MDTFIWKVQNAVSAFLGSLLLLALTDRLTERRTRCTELNGYLSALEGAGDLLTEFDGRLWNLTVDVVTVQSDGTMVFAFKDGRKLALNRMTDS